MINNLPLNALRTFEAAARHLQFAAAAEELCVTHGAVSKQVRSLEEHLGFQLFFRSGRRVSLTKEGQRLYEDMNPLFRRMAQSIRQLHSFSHSGVVRIEASPVFLNDWLCPRLGEFTDDFPDIRVHISPLLAGTHLPEGNDWVAVQFSESGPPTPESVLIERAQYVVVASPKLAYGTNPIRTPGDLLNMRLLHEDTGERWQDWFKANGLDWSPSDGSFVNISLATQLVAAVRAGVGIGLTVSMAIEEELRTGRLVSLFDKGLSSSGAYYLTAPDPNERSAEADETFNWIKDRFTTASSAIVP